MTTLLLRLAGPMQAWGVESRFGVRDTGREPSKSGVVGLIAAALGRPREASVDDLAALRMGVRVDREGTVAVDFQTVLDVARVPGKEADSRHPVVSRRYYLADASFLVGLEGDRGLLEQIDAALDQPRWPLFLGRKAFVPALPVRLPDTPPNGPGLTELTLEEALRAHPREPWDRGRVGMNRMVIEVDPGAGASTRPDQPTGAAFRDRTFLPRSVAVSYLAVADDGQVGAEA